MAWVELGRVQNEQHAADAARASFEHAIAADSKFVTPYQELARLALAEKNWAQLDAITDKLLELNPISFPEIWFYNAAANYYLQRLPDCRRVLGRESTSMRNITCPNLNTCLRPFSQISTTIRKPRSTCAISSDYCLQGQKTTLPRNRQRS